MAADDDNFFSRWSRRKVQVRTGQPLPVEPPAPVAPAPLVARAAPTLFPEQPEKAQASADAPAAPPAPTPGCPQGTE